MKRLKTYTELNEKLFINKFANLQKKILGDLNVNFFFIVTFGTAITALYPFFDTIVKTGEISNTTSQSDIVLLTICALAIIFKESKSDINKLMVVIKEKNLIELLDIFIDTIDSFEKLFSKISETVGKTINGLADMFAYTALFIPFILGLLDIIKMYQLNFENFDQILTNPKGALISTSIGVLTISLKHIINMLVKKISRKSKSKKTPTYDGVSVQFESVEKIYENYFSN